MVEHGKTIEQMVDLLAWIEEDVKVLPPGI